MVALELKEDKVTVERRVSAETTLKMVQEEPLEEQDLPVPPDPVEQKENPEEEVPMELLV